MFDELNVANLNYLGVLMVYYRWVNDFMVWLHWQKFCHSVQFFRHFSVTFWSGILPPRIPRPEIVKEIIRKLLEILSWNPVGWKILEFENSRICTEFAQNSRICAKFKNFYKICAELAQNWHGIFEIFWIVFVKFSRIGKFCARILNQKVTEKWQKKTQNERISASVARA